MTSSESSYHNNPAEEAYEAISEDPLKSLTLGVLAQAGHSLPPKEILSHISDMLDDPADPEDDPDYEPPQDTTNLVAACYEMQQAGLVMINQTEAGAEPEVELTPLGEQVGGPTADAIQSWYDGYGRVNRTPKELDIVREIIVGGAGTLERIAQALGITMEQAGQHISQLIKKGLVRRNPKFEPYVPPPLPPAPTGPPLPLIPRDAPLPKFPVIPAPPPPLKVARPNYDPPQGRSVMDRAKGWEFPPSTQAPPDPIQPNHSADTKTKPDTDTAGDTQGDESTAAPAQNQGTKAQGTAPADPSPGGGVPNTASTYEATPKGWAAVNDERARNERQGNEGAGEDSNGDKAEPTQHTREQADEASKDPNFIRRLWENIKEARERMRNRDYEWQTEPEEEEGNGRAASGPSGPASQRPDLNAGDFGGMNIVGTIEEIKASIIKVAEKLDANGIGSMLSALRFLEQSTADELNNAQHIISMAESIVDDVEDAVKQLGHSGVPFAKIAEATQAQKISDEWAEIYKELENRKRNLPEVIEYVQDLVDKINGIKGRL
ncbi:MAG TPA: helix-turn-helix domain-containing protein [Candidatus Saccharimonadales bacterium]